MATKKKGTTKKRGAKQSTKKGTTKKGGAKQVAASHPLLPRVEQLEKGQRVERARLTKTVKLANSTANAVLVIAGRTKRLEAVAGITDRTLGSGSKTRPRQLSSGR